MLIEFDNTLFDTDSIAAVRKSPLDGKHTVIFTVGQSAVDGGFLVHVPYHKVIRRLREARMSELMEMAEMMDYDEEDEEDEEEESESTTGTGEGGEG